MPDWKNEIERRLAGLRIEPTREAEIVEELSQHLDDCYAEALASGAKPDEARRAALAELADPDLLAREMSGLVRREPADPPRVSRRLGGTILADAIRDVRYGGRALRRSPAYTIVALVTLALGIGANTAIFSLVYAVVLRPLPYPDPGRLLFLAETSPRGTRMGVAYPDLADWRERSQSFDEMAGFAGGSFNLTGGDTALRLQGRRVHGNFFRILGVAPQAGRLFSEDDDRLGATAVAVISDSLWRSRFGADPSVVGSAVQLDGEPVTVVGVLPRDFQFLPDDELYMPLGPAATEKSGLLDRGNHFGLYVLARMKPGVTVEDARNELGTIEGALAAEYPNTNSGNGAQVLPLAGALVEDVQSALYVLLGAVAFVLLIACANVANLSLVRASERRRELAVRLALGAGRGRIVRQLLAECVLLSVVGGVAGIAVGYALLKGLLALAPPGVPRLDQTGLDLTVLAFSFGISVGVGVLFGLLPALDAARTDLNTAQKDGTRTTSSPGQERLRRGLLVAEVAIALVLLAGAGLMLKTVSHLASADPGFDGSNLLTMRFNIPPSVTEMGPRREIFRACIERVGALPGVRSVALSNSLPIDGSNWNSVFIVGDKPVPPRAELPSSAFTPVTHTFLATMGMRLLAGRDFTPADVDEAPRVAIVNETLARKLWPGEDPVGKRLKQGWPEDDHAWREVVGVAADVKLEGVDQDTPMQVYLPIEQETPRSVVLLVRTADDPLAHQPSVERALHDIVPDAPVYRVRSMEQVRGEAIGRQRLTMALLAGFGALALLLSAVGIYGVMSYSVTQRTHDIGVRMALGARPADVLRLVVGQGVVVTLVGLGIGLAAAFGLTRLMEGLLFDVSATDPTTFAAISVVLAAVAVLACLLPARRAARVDPVVALRHE